VTTALAAAAFVSLSELQENHATLVKQVGKDLGSPANQERIGQFVHKCITTGAVLDAPDDRAAAQSLILFWTASRECVTQ